MRVAPSFRDRLSDEKNRCSGLGLNAHLFFPIVIPAIPALSHTADQQANQHSENPSISGTGRYVAFISSGTNLVAGDTNGAGDIFVRDRQRGSTERVSISSTGQQANQGGADPMISTNGRYVTFWSGSPDLVSGDTNNAGDIFVHDRELRTTTRVSVTSSGAQIAGVWGAPAISGDGRYVVFMSSAAGVVAGDANGTYDVFLHDRNTATTRLISKNSQGNPGNGASVSPWISSDGSTVVFESDATDLGPSDGNANRDIYSHGIGSGVTRRVSIGMSGADSNGWNANPVVSSDGRYVSFDSTASNLVPNDTNALHDVFVYDHIEGDMVRASVSPQGQQSNGTSLDAYISGNGRWVSFYSTADNIHGGPDNNGGPDIFVHDIFSGYTVKLSFGCNGNDCTQESNGGSYNPVTDDGSVVAYESDATNIDYSDTTPYRDIFTADILSGADELISKSGNIAPFATLNVTPTQGTTATTFSVSMSGTHDQNGDSITYQIAWGDGSTTNSMSGSHQYSASGGYTITATATDQHGATESRTRQVLVDNRAPVAQFSVTPSSGDRSTTFSANMTGSSDPDGDSLTYRIDWGDGAVTNAISGSHVYSGVGTHVVTGTVTDSRGASASTSREVVVSNRPPNLVFEVTPHEGDIRTTFAVSMNGTTDPDGDTLHYRIDWGDGTSTNGATGSHQYSSPGRYLVTGTAIDQFGESTSDGALITVCAIHSDAGCVSTTPPADTGTICADQQVCAEEPSEIGGQPLPAPTPLPDDIGAARVTSSLVVISANLGNGDESPRPAKFADRVKFLTHKSRSIESDYKDGIGGNLPDLILLQEVNCDITATVVAQLNAERNFGTGTFAGPACGGGTDTAIVFNRDSLTFKTRKRAFTTHNASDIGVPSFTDLETGEEIGCPEGTTSKAHWMAKFAKDVGEGFVAVSSAHFIPRGCLNPLTDVQKDNRYNRWAGEMRAELNSFGSGAAFFVAGGDFNNHRCDPNTPTKEFGDCRDSVEAPLGEEREWWFNMHHNSDTDESRNFIDAVFDRHCSSKATCDANLRKQYRDGATSLGDANRRDKRIDFIFVRSATEIVAASHDLSCGIRRDPPNCKDENNEDRYSDHRLMWAIVR